MGRVLKVLYAVSLFAFSPLILSGQTGRVSYAVTTADDNPEHGFSYKAPVCTFIKSDDPSGRYFHISMPGHHYTSQTGEPELPVMVKTVTVPAGSYVNAVVTGIQSTTIRLKERGLKGMVLYPSQPEATKNESPDERVKYIDRKNYKRKGIIDHDTVSVRPIGRWRGKDIWEVAIYPAFYSPQSETLDLITSMDVKVSYSASKGSVTTIPAEDYESAEQQSLINGYSDYPIGLIILTDTIFKKGLKSFIDWKTKSGYDVRVLYTGAGNAGSTFDEIKASLTSLYNNLTSLGRTPDYLLIVGGLSRIPSSGGTTNVSDLYYSEFDGNGDYLPELYTGRIPVTDTVQLRVVMKKITDYEKCRFLPSADFWKRALTTAGNDAGYQLFMNSQVNYLRSNYFNSSNGIDGYGWYYPSSPQKDDSLKILINNGLSILNYTGHGEAAGLADPTLKVSGIASLNNQGMYPLVVANACRTAQLDATSCFGKEMLLAENKGAIGYIGCTNDSYWTEDFYWSVGTGNPDMSATYDNTGLGAFDRLFHTHNESPSQWYYTLGQMLFAGNMSVSASTSSLKKYYWETYILLGDPTMIPFTGKPDTINPALPDTIPQVLGSLSFVTKPHAYAAISDFHNLWDASYANNSGSVSLDIPAGIKDSCLVVITGQNIAPFARTIHIGKVSSEFLSLSNTGTDDSFGNNDGFCDYGETIGITFKLKNYGLAAASNISASLSVISGGITIDRNHLWIDKLEGGDSLIVSDSLLIKISDETKDMDIASVMITVKDDAREYHTGMDFVLHAPDPAVVSCIPDDYVTGNGNGVPDAGETVSILVKVKNNGSSPASGTVQLSDPESYFEAGTTSSATGILMPSGSALISLPVRISDKARTGTRIPFKVNLVCGKYSASGFYNLRTGKTRETWEENNFSIYPWINKSAVPWTISSVSAYENLLSARSGQITDNAESILALRVNTPFTDTLTFHARVSSEALFDKLIFRIDSAELMSVSGESGWFSKSFLLKPGVHYLEWVYKKDKSLSEGSDAAWVDLIDFPSNAFLATDIAVDSVYEPPASADHSHDIISGRVVNLGTDTLITLPLSYRINSRDPVSETFIVKMAPGDTTVLRFGQTANFRIPGTYNIKLYNSLVTDGYHANDTASYSWLKTTIDTIYEKDRYLILTPNPFTDKLRARYYTNIGGVAVIDILDLSGRVFYKTTIGVVSGLNDINIDLPAMEQGIYIIRATQDNYAVKTKAVKVKRTQ